MARNSQQLRDAIKTAEADYEKLTMPRTRQAALDRIAYLHGELRLQVQKEAREAHEHSWLPAVASWGIEQQRCVSCGAVRK